ncbi:hypothetical protein Lepto7376_4172 [[Leptolyngbya] sp. PCC 7376]|uniref:hypothetical protein n=1 Tax=[Leptolyngbya] sp. PCC 7376 TaxID=111781 RepID=UPI00029F1C3E|nr:hypothetical protein [[Leptolyngbya] sp. PCC 7376]AFY40292.1 hypothetical protein Lepto7376_4172 [[Leptolyngbya] sp. PCC 7376]
MSRFSKIIDQLEELNEQDRENYQQDVKNTSQIFAITAHLYERLHQLSNSQEQPRVAVLPSQKITKEFLIETFGNYDKAYQAYQQTHGIKCRKGWKNLLPLIQNLSIPDSISSTTEERLKNLEEKVDLLVDILLNSVSKIPNS